MYTYVQPLVKEDLNESFAKEYQNVKIYCLIY